MIKYAHFVEERPVQRTWINEHGQEVLDQTPRQVNFPQLKAPSSVMDLVHQLYRRMKEDNEDVETFEDANNFDIPDEFGIEMEDTPYEMDFDHLAEHSTAVEEPSDVPADPEKVTE